jgi:GTP-binding protein Era
MSRQRRPKHVSGFISLLGCPNAGKSTLINSLVGQKVAIVSDKPQTTRQLVQGVLTTEKAQAIFLDTPGIQEGGQMLQRRMMVAVREALEERDLLLLIVDATRTIGDAERGALSLVRGRKAAVFLVLNKIDLIKNKQLLLPVIEAYQKEMTFKEVFLVSATKGYGVPELREKILRDLPAGPQYFPEDFITDQPSRFLAAELIREKVLLLTHQEVPHAVAVQVDAWEEGGKQDRIAATIFVERDGHKKIVIGAGGGMLKKIGTLAREEMQSLFGMRIHLDLHVKSKPNWRESNEFLNELDWRKMIGGDSHEKPEKT